MIKTYTTTPQKLTTTLQTILKNQTPKTTDPLTIKQDTLYHNNTPIYTHKNREYLQLIKQTLQENPNHTLQTAQHKAQQKYYKHITYDKTNQIYKITVN